MKLAVLQLDPTVGDLEGNTARLAKAYAGHADAVDLVVGTELAISGYYPYDLLDRPGFVDAQLDCLERLRLATRGRRAALVVGHVARTDGVKRLHNALTVLHDGRALFTYAKTLLPTYDVFAEDRHFARGPVDAERVLQFAGKRLGFLICEDAWYAGEDAAADPVARLADAKPELVIHINASPSNMGKIVQRRALIQRQAARVGAPWLYVNQVGATDDIVFDGGSFLYDPRRERFEQQLPWFEESVSALDTRAPGVERHAPPDRLEFLRRHIGLGLRDYLAKCGFGKVVVGCSGGIDSALTLALAVDALGPDKVVAVAMPGPYSSGGSVTDSETLCRNLGIVLERAPITDEYASLVQSLTHAMHATPARATRENLQARLRGITLMAWSNQFGHLVLSTGNKSEMAAGYATLYGDMNGGINLIGDLYKTEVYELVAHMNRHFGREAIPDEIVAKPPSAELAPGQKDQDSLPPYPVLDALLKLYIERETMDVADREACEALVLGLPPEEVGRVIRMVDKAEFKRRQAPPILRLRPRAFGDGRRLPIAHKHDSALSFPAPRPAETRRAFAG